jgi:hypothetical protein
VTNVYRTLVGRPTLIGEANIKMDVKEIKREGVDWTESD